MKAPWAHAALVVLLGGGCLISASGVAADASAAAADACDDDRGDNTDGTCSRSPPLTNDDDDNGGGDDDDGADIDCRDLHERCPYWAAKGECGENGIYMRSHCARSCGACDDGGGHEEEDSEDDAEEDSEDDAEEEEDGYGDDIDEDDDDEEEEEGDGCRDRHFKCKYWAQIGECTENVPFMNQKCPMSCGVCNGDGGSASSCEDVFRNCAEYVSRGDCLVEKSALLTKCRRSCYFCTPNDESADRDELGRNKMYQSLRLGPSQDISGTLQERESARENLRQVDQYLRRVMLSDDVGGAERARCTNRSTNCAYWTGLGRCEDKREFMLRNCRLSCMACTGGDGAERG